MIREFGMRLIWSAGFCSGLGVAAYTVSRYGFRQPRGLPRTLAAVVLAWAWLTVGAEALGSFAMFARGPLLAWVVFGGLIAGWVRLVNSRNNGPRTTGEPWRWEEVAAGALVLWASASHAARSLLQPVKVVSDGPIYHLYFAARWWKTGRIEPIAAPFGENAATYFPAVGDLWFAWLMTVWGGDRLARVGQAPFYVVAGLAAVAIARRLGASRAASIVAAAWFLTSVPFFTFTFEPNVDTIFVAGYLLAGYFFVRHALGDDGQASLALGAIAAGCALGTKAPAILFVPPLLGLGAASALGRERGWRGKAVGLALVGLSPLLVAGFWYAREAARTGNPLYPLHLSAFGRVWLRGWYGPEVMRFSQYYLPVWDWRTLADMSLVMVDPRLAPFWLVAVAGAWALGRRREVDRRVDRYVWLCSALVVVNVAIFWLAVPYRSQQRFLFQALGLSAVPLARLLDRSRSFIVVGVVLLAVHLLTSQVCPFSEKTVPWDFSPNIPSDVMSLIQIPGFHDLGGTFPGLLSVGTTAGAGLLSFLVVWAWGRTKGFLGTACAIAATAALAAVVGLPVYPWGMTERRAFFPGFPDYYHGWLALDRASGSAGTRVAYAGTNLPYYLMGSALRNDVRYVNVDAHRGWLLHDYHREALASGNGPATWPNPRPGWDRLHPDYRAWLANLRAEEIRLLVVTRANPDNGLHNIADRYWFPIERQWADAHPEVFQPIYGAAEGDRLFRLYRLRDER